MIHLNEHEAFYIDEKTSTYFGFMREENIEDIETFYEEIARALSFPDFFGRNMDALEDMMSDLDWIPYQYIFLVIRNANSLSFSLDENYDPIMDILNSTMNERLEIILID